MTGGGLGVWCESPSLHVGRPLYLDPGPSLRPLSWCTDTASRTLASALCPGTPLRPPSGCRKDLDFPSDFPVLDLCFGLSPLTRHAMQFCVRASCFCAAADALTCSDPDLNLQGGKVLRMEPRLHGLDYGPSGLAVQEEAHLL